MTQPLCFRRPRFRAAAAAVSALGLFFTPPASAQDPDPVDLDVAAVQRLIDQQMERERRRSAPPAPAAQGPSGPSGIPLMEPGRFPDDDRPVDARVRLTFLGGAVRSLGRTAAYGRFPPGRRQLETDRHPGCNPQCLSFAEDFVPPFPGPSFDIEYTRPSGAFGPSGSFFADVELGPRFFAGFVFQFADPDYSGAGRIHFPRSTRVGEPDPLPVQVHGLLARDFVYAVRAGRRFGGPVHDLHGAVGAGVAASHLRTVQDFAGPFYSEWQIPCVDAARAARPCGSPRTPAAVNAPEDPVSHTPVVHLSGGYTWWIARRFGVGVHAAYLRGFAGGGPPPDPDPARFPGDAVRTSVRSPDSFTLNLSSSIRF